MWNLYHFEYYGQEFRVNIDLNNSPITNKKPNLKVIAGDWPSWQLDPDKSLAGEICIHRCAQSLQPDLEERLLYCKGDDGYMVLKHLGTVVLPPIFEKMQAKK